MPHFNAFGMMNLQYEIRICHKIHDKGIMSKCQYKLSGTDFIPIYSSLNQSQHSSTTVGQSCRISSKFGANTSQTKIDLVPETYFRT